MFKRIAGEFHRLRAAVREVVGRFVGGVGGARQLNDLRVEFHIGRNHRHIDRGHHRIADPLFAEVHRRACRDVYAGRGIVGQPVAGIADPVLEYRRGVAVVRVDSDRFAVVYPDLRAVEEAGRNCRFRSRPRRRSEFEALLGTPRQIARRVVHVDRVAVGARGKVRNIQRKLTAALHAQRLTVQNELIAGDAEVVRRLAGERDAVALRVGGDRQDHRAVVVLHGDFEPSGGRRIGAQTVFAVCRDRDPEALRRVGKGELLPDHVGVERNLVHRGCRRRAVVELQRVTGEQPGRFEVGGEAVVAIHRSAFRLRDAQLGGEVRRIGVVEVDVAIHRAEEVIFRQRLFEAERGKIVESGRDEVARFGERIDIAGNRDRRGRPDGTAVEHQRGIFRIEGADFDRNRRRGGVEAAVQRECRIRDADLRCGKHAVNRHCSVGDIRQIEVVNVVQRRGVERRIGRADVQRARSGNRAGTLAAAVDIAADRAAGEGHHRVTGDAGVGTARVDVAGNRAAGEGDTGRSLHDGVRRVGAEAAAVDVPGQHRRISDGNGGIFLHLAAAVAAAVDISGHLCLPGDGDGRVCHGGDVAAADHLAAHNRVAGDGDGGFAGRRRRITRSIRIIADVAVAAADDGASGGILRRVDGDLTAGDGDAAVALDLPAPGAAADDRIGLNRAAVDVDAAVAVDRAGSRSDQERGIQHECIVRRVGGSEVDRRIAVDRCGAARIGAADEIRIGGLFSPCREGCGEEVGRDVAVDRCHAAACQRIVDLPACVGVVDFNQIDDDGIRVDYGIFHDVRRFRRGVDLRDILADHGNRTDIAGDVEPDRIIGRETLHRVVHRVERVEAVVRRGPVDEGHLIIGGGSLPLAVDIKFLRAIRPDQIEVVVENRHGVVITVVGKLDVVVSGHDARAGVVDQLVDAEFGRTGHVDGDRSEVVQRRCRDDQRIEIHVDRAAVLEDPFAGVVCSAEVVDRHGRVVQIQRSIFADEEPHVAGAGRGSCADVDRAVDGGERTRILGRTDEELAGEFPLLTGDVERTAIHDNRGGGVGAFRRGGVVLVIVTHRRADGHDAGVGRAGDVHQTGLRTVGILAAGVAGIDCHNAVDRAVDVQRTQNIAGFPSYRECRTFGDVDRAGRVDVRVGDLRRRLHIVGAAVGGVPRVGLEGGVFAGGDIHRDPPRIIVVVFVSLLVDDLVAGEFAAQRHFRAGSNEQIVGAAGKGDICAVEEVDCTVDFRGDHARSGNVDRTGVLQRHADCQGRRCHIDGSLVFN